MDLDGCISESIGEFVRDPQSLLRPSATHESEPERLVEDQPLVDLATRAVDADHGAMRNDLDTRGVDVVDTQEVIRGALARKYPPIDGVEARCRRGAKVRQV